MHNRSLKKKIKDLPKQLKDFLKSLGLNEDKDINERQPLGPELKACIPAGDELYQDHEDELLTALNQLIEAYEKNLEKAISKKSKLPNRKNFIDYIKYMFQVGANPELLYRAQEIPQRNPLIRALNIKAMEPDDGNPTLFSTILQHSTFDVNKTFYDEGGIEEYINPLNYMLGCNLNNNVTNSETIQELLDHPDLELNYERDLLFDWMIDPHQDPKITRTLLDYGCYPAKIEDVKSDKDAEQKSGTLLRVYDELVSCGSTYREAVQSFNYIFNCGRQLDLSLKNKNGETLFDKCASISNGNAFVQELCVKELKIQALQKWQALRFRQSAEKKSSPESKLEFTSLYPFFGQALGDLSSDGKHDYYYLHAFLMLHEKVIIPIAEATQSLAPVETLDEITIPKIKELLADAGFDIRKNIVESQEIKLPETIKNLTIKSEKKPHPSSLTPLEYATLKGDRFLFQVLLMSQKEPTNKDINLKVLRLAISAVNLNIIQLLLSRQNILPLANPFSVFKHAMDSSHYYDPERQFAAVQLLLEDKSINNSISNQKLGSIFITVHKSKNTKLSTVLFREIKRRVLTAVELYPEEKDFKKYIASEFFPRNPDALDARFWGFLLRPLNPEFSLEESKINSDSKEEKSNHTLDEKLFENASQPTVAIESTLPQTKTVGRVASLHFMKFYSGGDQHSSSESIDSKLEIKTIKDDKDILNTITQIHTNSFRVKKSTDFDLIAAALDEPLLGLTDDAEFNQFSLPLLDNAFKAFRDGPTQFQKAVEIIQQLDIKKLSRFIVRRCIDRFRKTGNQEWFEMLELELAVAYTKKMDKLDDSDHRLTAMLKVGLGSHTLYPKYDEKDYDTTIHHFKNAIDHLSSIQKPSPKDILLKMFCLMTVEKLFSQFPVIPKKEIIRVNLRMMECYCMFAESQDLPITLPRLDHIKSFLSELDRPTYLEVCNSIVTLIYNIKDQTKIKRLPASQLEMYRVALLALISDDKLVSKNGKMLLDCYLNVCPPDTIKKFEDMTDREHAEAVKQLQRLTRIAAELSADDIATPEKIKKLTEAHTNAIKNPEALQDKQAQTHEIDKKEDESRVTASTSIEAKVDVTAKMCWTSTHETELGLVFATEEMKHATVPSGEKALLFATDFFTQLKRYLISKLLANKLVFQLSMLDALIKRMEKQSRANALTMTDIAREILAFKKTCHSMSTSETCMTTTTEAEYRIITSSINEHLHAATDALNKLKTNINTINKILDSKYRKRLEKVKISETSIKNEQKSLSDYKQELDDLLKKRDTDSSERKEEMPAFKKLLGKAEALKDTLATQVAAFTSVEETYNEKSTAMSDDTVDSQSAIKAKLKQTKQERERKKELKNKNKQPTQEEKDRKERWQQQQKEKREQRKIEALKKAEEKQANSSLPEAQDREDKGTKGVTAKQKQQLYLGYTLKNIIQIGFHQAEYKTRHEKTVVDFKQESKEVAKSPGVNENENSVLDKITHYALLYCMSRSFHALQVYKNCGGYTAPALPKADIDYVRDGIIHGGAIASSAAAVIQSGEIFHASLPKDLIHQRNAKQLADLQLEQKDMLALLRSYKLTKDPERYVDNPYPLIVDEMPIYSELVKYHNPKNIADTNDQKLLEVVWIKTVPIIKEIMGLIEKSFPSAPTNQKDIDRFLETFLPHLQALKMLLAICGEFRPENVCKKAIKQLTENRDKLIADKTKKSSEKPTVKILDNSIVFYKFLSECRILRNSVAHDFPEDPSISDVYYAWNLLKCMKDTPSLQTKPQEIVKEKEEKGKEKKGESKPASSSHELLKKALAKAEFVPRKNAPSLQTKQQEIVKEKEEKGKEKKGEPKPASSSHDVLKRGLAKPEFFPKTSVTSFSVPSFQPDVNMTTPFSTSPHNLFAATQAKKPLANPAPRPQVESKWGR